MSKHVYKMLELIGSSPDSIEDAVQTAVTKAHERGLRPISSLVRRSSLEDVFLRLTGRSLID